MDIRLGFDIGGTNVRAGIFDMAADKISMHAHAPFPIGKGPHALVAAMEGMAGGFARQLGIALADFRSVG
ncbi:MAG TPA: hypothetical protein VLA21_00590, partial [Candidatus Limnocylindria bacterium]|nr:hypothetical protein [Candidatus Limnocylindria bacterium]